MAKTKANPKEPEKQQEEESVGNRGSDISGGEKVRKHLLDIYKDVVSGFQDQLQRSDDTVDHWDAYNCVIGNNQFYNGNSHIYVPIIAEAIDARVTRFSNQLFPVNGRYIECTSSDGSQPYAHMALLEHYVGKSKLKSKIKGLLKQGDVEGQYSIFVNWKKIERHTTKRVRRGINVAGMEIKEAEDFDDIEEEDIVDSFPDFEVLSDSDLLVWPQTVDTIEEAIEKGGGVAVAMRLTKKEVKAKIKEGEFTKAAGEAFLKGFGTGETSLIKNMKKELASEAGIKIQAKKKFALVYMVHTRVKVKGKQRICKIYFGGGDKILGATLNPLWCDRVPVFSAPVKKIAGVFKGISPLKSVISLQYAANDAINEAMDSATYSLLPIIMTDPEKNPRVGSMVMNLAAIWETNPNDTKFATFPQLWKDGFEIVSQAKNEIFQKLNVNPAMMPSGNNTKKKNQAEIANEQQVDLLTTAEAVTVLEDEILTPLMEMWFEMDHQFRDEPITVRKFGELGIKAKMEDIDPIQMDERYTFKWLGAEQARNMQQLQQQISYMNVLRGIPPQFYPGRVMDLTPLIENAVQNIYGPRLGPLIFKDARSQLSIDPETENMLLSDGFEVEVHAMDNDQQHIQKHLEALKQGDPTGQIRAHIIKHQQQAQKKQTMMMEARMKQAGAMRGQGTPGTPGKPGIAGVPRPGTQPQSPANMKQPPGAVHRDQMGGGGVMPRKM